MLPDDSISRTPVASTTEARILGELDVRARHIANRLHARRAVPLAEALAVARQLLPPYRFSDLLAFRKWSPVGTGRKEIVRAAVAGRLRRRDEGRL